MIDRDAVQDGPTAAALVIAQQKKSGSRPANGPARSRRALGRDNPDCRSHAQPEQPLLRSPHQLPKSLLHALREHSLSPGRLSDRYGLIHGGFSFGLGRSTRHAPTGSGRAGGTAVTSKFYEPRDNLR